MFCFFDKRHMIFNRANIIHITQWQTDRWLTDKQTRYIDKERKKYLLYGNILLEQPDFPHYQLTLRHRLTLFSPTVETRQLWASSNKLVMMDRTFCRGLDCLSHSKEWHNGINWYATENISVVKYKHRPIFKKITLTTIIQRWRTQASLNSFSWAKCSCQTTCSTRNNWFGNKVVLHGKSQDAEFSRLRLRISKLSLRWAFSYQSQINGLTKDASSILQY